MTHKEALEQSRRLEVQLSQDEEFVNLRQKRKELIGGPSLTLKELVDNYTDGELETYSIEQLIKYEKYDCFVDCAAKLLADKLHKMEYSFTGSQKNVYEYDSAEFQNFSWPALLFYVTNAAKYHGKEVVYVYLRSYRLGDKKVLEFLNSDVSFLDAPVIVVCDSNQHSYTTTLRKISPEFLNHFFSYRDLGLLNPIKI